MFFASDKEQPYSTLATRLRIVCAHYGCTCVCIHYNNTRTSTAHMLFFLTTCEWGQDDYVILVQCLM